MINYMFIAFLYLVQRFIPKMNDLHRAVRNVDINECRHLVQNGIIDVNEPDLNGMTPLHYACFYANSVIIKFLVRAGANVNTQDNDGRTPVLILSYFMDSGCIEFLIQNGADLNICDVNGCNVLHHGSCYRDKTECLKLLISKGVDINKQDRMGFSPLLHAVSNGAIENARCLLDNGANLSLTDRGGRTALERCFNPTMRNMLRSYEVPEIKEPEQDC